MAIGDALEAVDTLDDMLHNAKLVPLSDRVRMDPDALNEMVRLMRSHLEIVLHGLPAPRTRAALNGLEAEVREARPVRLLRGVSVDKGRMYDLLDEIRQQLAEELRPPGAERPTVPEHLLALDELEDIVTEAPTIPLSDQVRIDPVAFRTALDRVRAEFPPGAEDLLDRITAAFEAARGVPLSPYVRVDRDELLDLIDLLRAEAY